MTVDYKEKYASSFIKGIALLTGIPENRLKKYAAEQNLFNVLEHPNTIAPNKQQFEKIHLLNDFISSYQLLKLQENENKLTINSTKKAGEYFSALLGGTKDREKFMTIFLDSRGHVIESRTMFEGSIGEAAVYPREVLKAALDCDCVSIILAHNHPGGSMKPSVEDLNVTQTLVSIFTPLQIKILDHIIVAGTGYHSMTESGEMPLPLPQISYDVLPLDKGKAAEEEQTAYQSELGSQDDKEEWGFLAYRYDNPDIGDILPEMGGPEP